MWDAHLNEKLRKLKELISEVQILRYHDSKYKTILATEDIGQPELMDVLLSDLMSQRELSDAHDSTRPFQE